ncbi:radical SAM protein [Geoalkalibacter sp.]|uniref:radical SAM protein n=1 Tax=Geoalkalibacter sp. TaxID=3041440 RepID=UPI00272E73B7|nr:radical SAM protein [Geoalkalibacter sp.]
MIAKLFCNGVRFRQLRRGGKPYRLQSLSLEVTHRCICRCDMCNIWKIPAEVADLELADWLAVLRSPALRHLRELDITGGEPFLRADLGELLQRIVAFKPEHFPALRTLSITTNALLSERILAIVRECIGPLRACGVDLVLACGVDAAGKLHDRIRNVPGAWERVQPTLSGLQEIRAEHANLILGIKTTIIPRNVHELPGIANFAAKHDLFTIISPCILTANRFANLDKANELHFDPIHVRKMIEFYESSPFAWSGHCEALLGYLKTGTMRKPCSAGYNTLFVRHNGEVFGCPVLANSVGDVRTQPLDRLFRGEAANQFRKQVGAFPECAQCTEPGMERIAWPLDGFALLGFWAERGRGDFDRLVRHMGLDKYL